MNDTPTTDMDAVATDFRTVAIAAVCAAGVIAAVIGFVAGFLLRGLL